MWDCEIVVAPCGNAVVVCQHPVLTPRFVYHALEIFVQSSDDSRTVLEVEAKRLHCRSGFPLLSHELSFASLSTSCNGVNHLRELIDSIQMLKSSVGHQLRKSFLDVRNIRCGCVGSHPFDW